jgi:hypothetical protein
MNKITLYAMVDKAGHVCRDEDGKVVYDRPNHPNMKIKLFDQHRPHSAPHRIVELSESREGEG